MSISIWRKLWASISLSKKVNRLSDQAALFWTWAIPHFSTHGFLDCDPEDLKSIVVPLRTSYTPEIINSCIQEILNQNLWNAYVFKKGRVYPTIEGRVNVILHDPRWFEMQNMRKDRIGKPPYNIKEMERIYVLLPEYPGVSRSIQVPEYPGRDESEMRVREKNKAEKNDDRPVDNPDRLCITKEQTEHLDRLCLILKNTFGRPKHTGLFNPYQFIQKFKTAHPDAMIKTLSRMIEDKDEIISPWPWAEHVLKLESQNYNARDFQTKSEKDKSIYDEFLTDIKEIHRKKEK